MKIRKQCNIKTKNAIIKIKNGATKIENVLTKLRNGVTLKLKLKYENKEKGTICMKC